MVLMNDVTILGAGPSGIAAAIYLKRAGVHPLILEKKEPGGLLRQAYLVEDYPGFPKGINGYELVERFVEQLNTVGISITKSTVTQVDLHIDKFDIHTDCNHMISSAVIVATGTIPRKPAIRGLPSMEGIHLFYDPWSIPFNRTEVKKMILVIGGGDIAFDYALTLLNWGHDVIVISRSKPRCLPHLYTNVMNKGGIIYTMFSPEEILKRRDGICLKCRHNNHIKDIRSDYILVACGRAPNTSFLAPALSKCLDEHATFPETSVPGLYFVGDVAHKKCRHVGIAVGDGIYAAMLADNYLRNGIMKP